MHIQFTFKSREVFGPVHNSHLITSEGPMNGRVELGWLQWYLDGRLELRMKIAVESSPLRTDCPFWK
uniref:Uncharacterized protein n=1 Tax=Arundo donax TaxID=35708 RepID=A0A0A9C0J9_ARUDO